MCTPYVKSTPSRDAIQMPEERQARAEARQIDDGGDRQGGETALAAFAWGEAPSPPPYMLPPHKKRYKMEKAVAFTRKHAEDGVSNFVIFPKRTNNNVIKQF